jgi:hypothetical protein
LQSSLRAGLEANLTMRKQAEEAVVVKSQKGKRGRRAFPRPEKPDREDGWR